MSAEAALCTTPELGWRSGLGNLWSKDSHRWWGHWNWLRQSLIWLFLLNGFLTIALVSLGYRGSAALGVSMIEASFVFVVSFFSLFIGIGAIIQAQGAIIDDRQRGTAAWILSKPTSRSAFILAKCAVLPGMLLTMVVLPGLVAVLQISLMIGQLLPITMMLMLLGWLAAALGFYFFMTLLLGTLFLRRTLVLGLALFVLMVLTQAAQLIPHALVTHQFMLPVGLVLALAGGGALCLLLAVMRFASEEF
ncbi:MAG: hypothetical protein H0X37_20990 [Herpetosiphonaceae bacterium]|nr:hypothetical protein [Herpetosiphonaceae bacterium]